jgi:hypothetical protein
MKGQIPSLQSPKQSTLQVLGKERGGEGMATSNEEGMTYIFSSLEPCEPLVCAPNDGGVHMRPRQFHGVRSRPIIRGARVHAPWPCVPRVAVRISIPVRTRISSMPPLLYAPSKPHVLLFHVHPLHRVRPTYP